MSVYTAAIAQRTATEIEKIISTACGASTIMKHESIAEPTLKEVYVLV